MRFVYQLIIIRNIIPIYNFEDRKSFQEDLAEVAQFGQMQVLTINILLLVFCINDKFSVHFPASIIYQFFNCYGYFALIY